MLQREVDRVRNNIHLLQNSNNFEVVVTDPDISLKERLAVINYFAGDLWVPFVLKMDANGIRQKSKVKSNPLFQTDRVDNVINSFVIKS